MATAPASILLTLALAFTVATTAFAYHPSPSPSDEAIVVKKCKEALGPDGSIFVEFCAHNFLGHRASLLATCDRRKTVAVVLKEVHNKAKAVEAMEKKINSDKSFAQDFKRCWRITNNVVSSIANVFNNSLVKEPSTESIKALKGMHGEVAAIKQHCDSKATWRKSGVWLELWEKVLESLTADMVAWAFVDQLYGVTH